MNRVCTTTKVIITIMKFSVPSKITVPARICVRLHLLYDNTDYFCFNWCVNVSEIAYKWYFPFLFPLPLVLVECRWCVPSFQSRNFWSLVVKCTQQKQMRNLIDIKCAASKCNVVTREMKIKIDLSEFINFGQWYLCGVITECIGETVRPTRSASNAFQFPISVGANIFLNNTSKLVYNSAVYNNPRTKDDMQLTINHRNYSKFRWLVR